MSGLIVFGIAALLAAFAVYWKLSSGWLPAELRAGTLLGSEVNFHADVPFPVTGRLDRVYQLRNGQHTPVEYKNREAARLHDSDRAQLSLQAWLLRRNGKATSPFGYLVVRERKSGRKKSLKVELMDDAACERMIWRHIEVKEGRASPQRVRDARCKSCGHNSVC